MALIATEMHPHPFFAESKQCIIWASKSLNPQKGPSKTDDRIGNPNIPCENSLSILLLKVCESSQLLA